MCTLRQEPRHFFCPPSLRGHTQSSSGICPACAFSLEPWHRQRYARAIWAVNFSRLFADKKHFARQNGHWRSEKFWKNKFRQNMPLQNRAIRSRRGQRMECKIGAYWSYMVYNHNLSDFACKGIKQPLIRCRNLYLSCYFRHFWRVFRLVAPLFVLFRHPLMNNTWPHQERTI